MAQKSRAAWKWVLALIVLAAAGYFGWRQFYGAPPAPAQQAKSAASAPVPVTVARVETADFPVYLNGLGVVEPYDTVTVRSRVDGEIIKVAFKQGQMVKEGDLLAQIDPRPYQAALDQAHAKKAQDEANLKNAQLEPAALRHARQAGFRLAPAVRHAAGDWSIS